MDSYLPPPGYYPSPSGAPPPPPPARKGLPVWGWCLIGCGLLFIGAAVAIVMFSVRMAKVFSGDASISGSGVPPAAVKVGKQLAWRELYKSGDIFMANAICADFDSDGADEVFLYNGVEMDPLDILSSSPSGQHFTGRIRIFEADGSKTEAGTNAPVNLYEPFAWDYDGDGKSEILNLGDRGDTLVYDTGMKQIASLRGEPLLQADSLGDVDGDGKADLLLLQRTPPESALVYGQGGKLIWDYHYPQDILSPMLGDADGDGRDELVFMGVAGAGAHDIVLAAPDQQDQRLSGLWDADGFVSSVIDVDGDKHGELFAAELGFFNPVSGALTKFQFPAGYQRDSSARLVYAVDINGDGKAEYVCGGSNYVMGSAVFAFDAAGQCVYYEEFGDTVEVLDQLTDAQGGRHIVVLTDRRLLIYP